MFEASEYKKRREALCNDEIKGQILINGNTHSPRNYSGNTYPFRQDSNFLYFAGIDLPDMHLIIDPSTGTTTLYANDISVDDAIWSGDQPKMTEWASRSGIEKVKPLTQLDADLRNISTIHYLPPYPSQRQIWLAEIFQKSVAEVRTGYSVDLIKSVVKLRSIKSQKEVSQIENALDIATSKMHIKAMQMALPGIMEYQVAAEIQHIMLANSCQPAYGTICTIHGEILHNEYYSNQLKNDQLLLIDAGAENTMHYASDITRTTPVGGHFSELQKSIYTIVLQALNSSIERIRPGIAYKEIHFDAARIIINGLKGLGIMKGDTEEALQQGAHAMFFPHGLGHMIGLDVHDMEDLGEDFVGYDEQIKRSSQFGTAFLRLGRKLEEGFVITVEPGLYFIPALIDKWKAEKLHENFINYSETEKLKNFGGVRIEDNVLVAHDSGKVLGVPIPKSVSDITALFE